MVDLEMELLLKESHPLLPAVYLQFERHYSSMAMLMATEHSIILIIHQMQAEVLIVCLEPTVDIFVLTHLSENIHLRVLQCMLLIPLLAISLIKLANSVQFLALLERIIRIQVPFSQVIVSPQMLDIM